MSSKNKYNSGKISALEAKNEKLSYHLKLICVSIIFKTSHYRRF